MISVLLIRRFAAMRARLTRNGPRVPERGRHNPDPIEEFLVDSALFSADRIALESVSVAAERVAGSERRSLLRDDRAR